MNRGTLSGDIAEIEFVKFFNTGKKSDKFNDYIKNFKCLLKNDKHPSHTCLLSPLIVSRSNSSLISVLLEITSSCLQEYRQVTSTTSNYKTQVFNKITTININLLNT